MPYPGLYPDINKIIPYSKNKRFGFMEKEKILDIELMKNMPIDQIVELYREGYIIAEQSPTIETAQGGVYISFGTLLLIGIAVLGYIYYKNR